MLPRNAIVIRPNRVAIVLDYDNKGIHIWRNLQGPEWLPMWVLNEIVTMREFGLIYPPDTLDPGCL